MFDEADKKLITDKAADPPTPSLWIKVPQSLHVY